jgi:p-aminobenzoyl-glutamate transporter AbgT
MPPRDKLIIAFTVLLLIVGPYMTYKMIESAARQEIKLVEAATDSSAAQHDREAAEINRRGLPTIVIIQIATLMTGKVGMVILSAMLIRNHRRRKRL